MAQIVCKDVVLGYEGKAVVQNLNFEVNKGDSFFLPQEMGSYTLTGRLQILISEV